MHGGKRAFVKRLQVVFDEGHYDPTRAQHRLPVPLLPGEGEEWRTQKTTLELLDKRTLRTRPTGSRE